MNSKNSIVCTLIIALAVVVGAMLLSNFSIRLKNNANTISVSGQASKKVDADSAAFSFIVSASAKDVASGYAKLQSGCAKTLNLLNLAGFSTDEIVTDPVQLEQIFVKNANGTDTNQIDFFEFTRRITVSSKNIQLIEYNSQLPEQLLAEGIEVMISTPVRYRCENPEQYFDELVKTASADAFKKAEIVAKAGGSKITSLLSSSSPQLDISGNSTKKEISVNIYAEYAVEE